MPNKRKSVSAAARRARKREGERRLKTRLDEATEACGAASRTCRQLEDKNRILSDAARSPRGNREHQQKARSLLVGLNLIPSIMETIQLSIVTCHPERGAGCADRHSADPAPDAAPGPADDSSHYSPRSGSGGSPSAPPSPAPCSPAQLSPSDLRQESWPGSPFSSLGD